MKSSDPDDYDDNYYPEPDDFEAEEREPKGPLSKFPSFRHARTALLFILLFYAASAMYYKYPIGGKLWVSGNAIFKDREYWRLLTSLFVHADILHLLSNALMFIIFGWLLKAYFGFFVFPVTAFIIGMAGSLCTISIYEPHVKLIGASGINYGIAALWLVFYLRYDTDHYFAVRLLRVTGFILAVLLPSAIEPHTSYLAHACGFVIGITTGVSLLPIVRARDPG